MIRFAPVPGRKLMALIAICLLLVPKNSATATTPADIQTAIDRGKTYLYQTQKDGNWEIVPAPDTSHTGGWEVENTQFGGLTAIATFALLASGEDPQDPRIRQAIAFLEKTESTGTYALALRCQLWNMIFPDPAVRMAMRRDRDLLIKGIGGKEPYVGFYGYDTAQPGADPDHSSSQFGVLGLWAVSQAGAEVPNQVWRAFDAGWRSHQLASGAWSYKFSPGPDDKTEFQPTLSMTAAGVATLFITQDFTQFAPKLAGNVDDPAIDAGVQWMGDHLTDLGTSQQYYKLFGISRVGIASGYKFIGSTDWFKWGADFLVGDQHPDGSWGDDYQNPNKVPNTSFSLLFLSRGRAPIVMNKLNYDIVQAGNKTVPGTWNQRPRDVANLTRMIGRQIESQLNWQVVRLNQNAGDLEDAPILYMSGMHPPNLSAKDQAVLKEFIENGGLVFGHADGSSPNFSAGFRKLGEAMFPGYRFRILPENHPIYVAENFPRANWASKPQLEGLSNGVRELMLLLPSGDPAKMWQSQSFPYIKKDVFGQLMIDIVLYSSDQEGLRQRGQTTLLTIDQTIHATNTLKIARIQYAGNWDPEPGGWRRLAIAMHNDRKIDLDIHPLDPATDALDKSFGAVHLAVLDKVSLSPAACKTIHDYVDDGGTLVVDVPGGAGVNRSEADAMIAKIFPEAPRPLPQLPIDNAIYSAGESIKEVDYRHYARSILGNTKVPRLKGWIKNDRVAIIYSPDDLSTGLAGRPMGGIVGYTPPSATRLMENILTYAAIH